MPLSRDPRLEGQLLAVALEPSPANGLQHHVYAMTWHPTTVDGTNLDGPLGRLTPEQLAMALERIATALDLTLQEPWLEAIPLTKQLLFKTTSPPPSGPRPAPPAGRRSGPRPPDARMSGV
ncbi:hypothetical protein [Cyanobium sp. Morenito 9A2]|uniref:hypothetical protein n=1 Tax=Cyanobium sp. Morenito 9A2 TaxID=2823718 RepID=UPI0020CB8742|nr:hypothetical protein [Cyanobium sp. Morenito 9A2]MCP9848703.1 hypothetical protein [Cyanobium sp. Morenito 9A2]